MIDPMDILLYGIAFSMFSGSVVLVVWIIYDTIRGIKAMKAEPKPRPRPYQAIRWLR